MSFARTKVQAPRFRDGLIERVELERRLGAALFGHRLVLLVAPAGYGKTAALSRQLALLPDGTAAAWMTADEEDDLPRFLSCLMEALEPLDPPWRIDPEALAGRVAQERGLPPVVDETVNALAAIPIEFGVIALDDLHCVTDPRVFEFLGMLIERLPPHWTFMIAARTPPPLSLARLRAQREVLAFDQADLSFSAQEVRRLSVAAGEEDSEEMAQSLLTRTQGWAAGLRLSLDAGRGAAATAAARRLSRRHLYEYLASEVFEQMPEELREFLMRCALLPELTATRCAAVSGNPRAAELLDEIERRGLFVSVLDSEEFTLRLHDLFRDFLEHRLRDRHAGEVPQLLRRAAETESDPVRKMNMLLRAGEWAGAEQVVEGMALLMLAKGDGMRVMQLIEQFPAELQASSPYLAYLRGLWAMMQFALPLVVKEMRQAAAGFEQRGERRNADRARVHEARALAIARDHAGAQALLSRLDGTSTDLEVEVGKAQCRFWRALLLGPAAAPAPHLDRITELLSGRADAAPWYWLLPVGEILLFGRFGMRVAVRRFARGVVEAATDEWPLLRAETRAIEAVHLLCEGRAAEAKLVMQQSQAEERWAGFPQNGRPRFWLLRAWYAAMCSDGEAAKAIIEEGRSVAIWNAATAVKGFSGAASGNWRDVAQALAAWQTGAPEMRASWAPFHDLLSARLALHEDRHEEVLESLREAVKTAADIDRQGCEAMFRVTLAVAEDRMGHREAAWSAVAPLVAQIESPGDRAGVLLCGAQLLAELAQGSWTGMAPAEGLAEVRRWAELSRLARASVAEEPAAVPASSMPLSGRELEVLQRIAAGDSNKLIARALDLSPHTVKRHVARILERLDLSSRGAAAAWYNDNAAGRSA